MFVQLSDPPLNQGNQDIPQEWSTGAPLVVRASTVRVRTIELGPRELPLEPAKGSLVADVHPESDLGLEAITAEVAFTKEESDEEALVKVGQRLGGLHGKHDGETIMVPLVVDE